MEKKAKYSGRDMAGVFLLGLSVILLSRSLALCFSNDIWYDELFTVGMVEHSYGELVRFTAADVHPPLYYCIVKLFVDLCKLIKPGIGTVIPAKMASVLPYFILLLYAVTLIRKRFGLFVGGLFLFCVMAMPQLPAYTVEVRMYGWALLFVTAAFLHAAEFVRIYVNQKTTPGKIEPGEGGLVRNYVNLKAMPGKIEPRAGEPAEAETENAQREDEPAVKETEAGRRQKWKHRLHGAALTFYGLAAAYTQYFACVAVVMVYLWVLFVFWRRDRRRIRDWLLCVAVSVIGYVPWLFALAGQLGAVSENYWILPLTWRSLGGCVKFLMKPAFTDDRVNTVLAVILSAAYLALWCRWASKLYYYRREKCENKENSGGIWKAEDEGRAERFFLATAGIWVLAGLVAFGFAASFLIRPVFVYRYMIPALGCFWLGFALCLDDALCKPIFELIDRNDAGDARGKLCKLLAAHPEKIKNHTGRHNNIGRNTFTYYAGIGLTILIAIVGLRDYRAFMGEEEYKIRLMEETEDALSRIGPQDSVLYNFDQVQAVTGYYLPETVERYLWRAEGEKLIQEITSPCGKVEDVQEIRKMLETMKAEGQGKTLWFIGSFNSREDIVAEWRHAGFDVEEMGSFLLERYWFNLYKIS